jgi:hypothetical protein
MERIHIDLNETVYTLCTKHPALVEILSETRFTDITSARHAAERGTVHDPVKGAAFSTFRWSRSSRCLANAATTRPVSQNDKHDKPNQEGDL